MNTTNNTKIKQIAIAETIAATILNEKLRRREKNLSLKVAGYVQI